jgi:hypothetical protein
MKPNLPCSPPRVTPETPRGCCRFSFGRARQNGREDLADVHARNLRVQRQPFVLSLERAAAKQVEGIPGAKLPVYAFVLEAALEKARKVLKEDR